MTQKIKSPLLSLLIAGFLSACAAGDLIVVIPEEGGRTGSVVVRQGDQSVVLDKPFAAARTGSSAPTRVTIAEAEVRTIFDRALSARPAAPISFTLYFKLGTTKLTPASAPELDKIFAELKRRAAAEVTVIGHTDRVGKIADNDRLALRRARAVREVLIKRGIKADIIDVAGRGERETLVKTKDEVAEPRNRRSEINIR